MVLILTDAPVGLADQKDLPVVIGYLAQFREYGAIWTEEIQSLKPALFCCLPGKLKYPRYKRLHLGRFWRILSPTIFNNFVTNSLPVPTTCQSRELRTLFLSDLHLGTRGCQAELLLDFLKCHHADTIYLVGDIIDGWRLRKKKYWPDSHKDLIELLLERGRSGSRIVYLPGNHDEFLRTTPKRRFNFVEFTDKAEHITADGRRYLVIHGDQYDVVIQKAKWIAYLGDRFYVTALALNTWLNIARRRMGLSYWSLGAFAKRRVKQFVNIIGKFESTVAADLQCQKFDGIICGHIHHAASKDIDGLHYLNTGDWVESCTAIGETFDGTLEIIRWFGPEQQRHEVAHDKVRIVPV